VTISLRPLGPDDIDALEAIEHVAYSAPWSRSMFASELSKPTARSLGAFAPDGTLLGYLILSRFVDAWHVMNVAVHPEHRREGIASRLLQRVFEDTAGDPARGYTLEVRVSNTGAVKLYERFGFEVQGLRKGYYLDNREDALIMWKTADPGKLAG
jgi:ribosomal-protein-alanine N-acetyltransferase